MIKANVYGIDGTVKDKIVLPDIFNTPYRPDIIRKSFNALRSNKRQPYGADPLAGTKHATASVGKGRGRSRVVVLFRPNGRAGPFWSCFSFGPDGEGLLSFVQRNSKELIF